MSSSLVSRFPNGIGTRPAAHPFADLSFPDPTKVHAAFTDFDTFILSEWLVSETQAGATQATAAGDGGILQLVNTAALGDINQIQKTPASFSFTLGKRMFFAARFGGIDADLTTIYAGLQLVNADGGNLASATQGMFFLKPSGTPVVSAYVRQANAAGNSASAPVGSLANGVYSNFYMAFDGVDKIVAGFGNSATASLIVNSANLPAVNLAPIFGIKNGAAASKTGFIDYLFAAKER